MRSAGTGDVSHAQPVHNGREGRRTHQEDGNHRHMHPVIADGAEQRPLGDLGAA